MDTQNSTPILFKVLIFDTFVTIYDKDSYFHSTIDIPDPKQFKSISSSQNPDTGCTEYNYSVFLKSLGFLQPNRSFILDYRTSIK